VPDGERAADGARLSRAAAHRLSLYLRCLTGWPAEAGKVSSGQIAQAVGVSDAQVRRDLAALGHLGRRGVGYEARDLAAAIRAALGIDRTWRAVIVGVGHLARALIRYQGFRAQGFKVVGLFDSDPAKLGERIGDLEVEPVSRVGERVPELGAELAVLTVPAEAAQAAADVLVAAGVRGILNFAPALLKLPSRVRLVTVDLAIQLEQLAFLLQGGEPEAPETE
jgi:redox-sensing transcriptional repressor